MTKKAPAKKTSKKVSKKKTTTKKAVTKKTTKKASTKKTTTKKAATKKTTVKKSPAKKVTKKKTRKKIAPKGLLDAADTTPQEPVDHADAHGAGLMDDVQPKKKRPSRRKVIDESTGEDVVQQEDDAQDGPQRDGQREVELDENGEPIKKRRRRRRGGRGRRKKNQEGEQQDGERSDEGRRDEREDAPREERPKRGRRQEPAAVDVDTDEDEPKPSVEDKVENWEEVFESQTFAELGLRDSLVRGVKAQGFVHPTKIQAELIPMVLDGHDVLGQSRTGTGKTAAFALPVLHSMERGVPFQCFVLAPTRELAIQIADEMRSLAKKTPLRIAAVYGGQKIHTQQRKLENGPEIVVATPGRLMDMKERGHLHFDNCKFAVLDEVDRMLDIGFRDDIRQILRQMPPERQTVFVSATISPEIENLSRTFMDDPQRLTTTGSSLTVSLVEQFYVSVEPWDKRRLLRHMLEREKPELTIVFCRTKRTVDKVAKYLTEKGIDAEGIHGDMYQGKRNTVIKQLRDGELSVMVASDLAARGLDVDGITHVVNYDLPDDPEIYIHRIGRTARAGRDGIAWAFVTPDQGGLLTDIEKLANTHVEPLEFPDFKPGSIPSDIRDERARDRNRVEGKRTQNRFEVPLPAPKKAVVDETKFPGGIVPTKRPPKSMRGRVRTTRSMKDAAKDDVPVDDDKKK